MQKKLKQSRDWWDHARIGRDHDQRVKLDDEDRQYINKLYKEGNPIREIARIFDGRCSRRLIQLILFPERYARIKARAKEVKRWEPYNTKDKRLEVMRKYRKHIRQVHDLKPNNRGTPIPSDQ